MTPPPVVLGYHAVSDRWAWRFSVTPDALRAHVELLLARGYRFLRFGDALRAASGRIAVLTFDDGYRSVVTRAAPVLRELGVPATLFVVTDHVGTAKPMRWPGIEEWLGGEHEEELAGVSWAELEELAAAGWELGSHTCTHRPLPDLDDDELERELGRSRAVVEERLGRACDVLAYPYGAHDARVLAAARAAGYRAAATFPPHYRLGDPLAVPRVGVYHEDGPRSFRFKISRTANVLRRLRR